MIRIAVLDDYQNVALDVADWSPLAGRAAITVFNDHLSNFDDVVERLLPFDVICVMRERTPLPRSVIEQLPRLKLIASTGPRNAAIDVEAVAERGIVVAHTGYENAVSCVSLTTVRNRTTESAPTRLNARATLSPMTWVAMAITVARRIRVVRNVGCTASPRRAQR